MKEKAQIGQFVQNLLDRYWNDGVIVTNPRNGKKIIIPEGIIITDTNNTERIQVPEIRLKDPSYIENIMQSLKSIADDAQNTS